MLHVELSTLKMQNEGELFYSRQICCKLKAYHGTQRELGDRTFSLMCPSISSCTHQKRLTVFSLDEYFSKLHLNRNTQYTKHWGNSCRNVLAFILKSLIIRRNNKLRTISCIWIRITLQNFFGIRALLCNCIKSDTTNTATTMHYPLCIISLIAFQHWKSNKWEH